MVGKDLYCVAFRPEAQKKTLAGGQARGEVLVPESLLDDARREIAGLRSIISNVGRVDHVKDFPGGGIEKELVALYRGVALVLRCTDNLLRPTGEYKERGYPGVEMYAENYYALRDVAEFFGLNVPPQELLDLDRRSSLAGKVREK